MGHFSSWHDFWRMGGYAMYVWPAYLAVILVFFFTGYSRVRRLRHLVKHLKQVHSSKSSSHVNKT